MKRGSLDVSLAGLVLVLLLTQVGARVEAAPRSGEAVARQHFRLGEELYARERYADALLEFDAGYVALPLPGFLINIGQCRRRLGDLDEARRSYERFVQQAPDSPLAPAVRNLIKELSLTPPPLQAAPVEPASPPPDTAIDSPLVAPGTAWLPAPRARAIAIDPPAVDAVVRGAPDHQLGTAPPATTSRRTWWIVGGVAIATATVTALVIGSGRDTTTTIHDGTLGTLRR